MAITSPTDCMRVPRRSVGTGQLLEGPARDLGHDVVDGGLEARRSGAGDVVGDLVERVAHGQARRRSWRWGTPSPSTPARRSATRAGSSRSRVDDRRWVAPRTGCSTLRSPPRPGGCRRRHRRAWPGTRRRTSVCAGATVIESPVCTPMGSKFSMEQTTTQLSTRSRITSSSNSFHPAMDRSIRIWCTGLAARPSAATRANSARVVGRPRARPTQDETGPDHEGEADPLAQRHGLVEVRGEPRRGDVEADLLHGGLELVAVLGGGDGLARWRRSARRRSRRGRRARSRPKARFRPVCPPMVGNSASGRSRSTIARSARRGPTARRRSGRPPQGRS